MSRILIPTLYLIITASPLAAQNFFWSTSNLGETLVEGDLTLHAQLGDTDRVFLYYSPNGQDIRGGIDLDFSWATPDVAAFTFAETLEFDISIMGIPFDLRWGDFVGPANVVTSDSVTGFLTVNVVSGTGILTDQADGADGFFLDEGSFGGFFQIGFFDWVAAGEGTTDLRIDSALVLTGGQDIGPAFSGLTINVGSGGGTPIVPEPKIANILVLVLAGLVSRRRRKVRF